MWCFSKYLILIIQLIDFFKTFSLLQTRSPRSANLINVAFLFFIWLAGIILSLMMIALENICQRRALERRASIGQSTDGVPLRESSPKGYWYPAPIE